ncbi:uncharacterized protein LOC110632409 [Hevea brasiliensis]|uniref:uncharacterized protein LOC110632409 n=1 Tax=Hevea brasiliensis TaxID=3981 RepID=UPI0025D33378|nr:uncharacterized protein LOC110632409 [Hevea brasiliensis]
MKNVSRNKFFLCFRPVVDMDQQVLDSNAHVNHSKDQPLAYAGVENKKNAKHLRSKSLILDYGSSTSFENSLIFGSPRKTFFSRSIKAVFFSIFIGLNQDIYGSRLNSLSSNSTKSLDTSAGDTVNNVDNVQEIKTNSVSFSSSSSSKSASSLSSCSSCSTSISEPNNLLKPPKTMGNSLIYLLLFSLTMTIFLGKLNAILFTTIWLYFLPRFHVSDDIRPSEDPTSLAERKESKEYKKRIIMEGLLERNYRLAPESHRRSA